MEKAKFTFSDGSGADEFFVLEETKINEELLEDVDIEM